MLRVAAAVVLTGLMSVLPSGAGANVTAHAASKGCGPNPTPAPFTSQDLAKAVNFADCVGRKVILKGESKVPELASASATVCDEVQAHPQARPALTQVAKTIGKTADVIDAANNVLKHVNHYFVHFANYELIHHLNLHSAAAKDNELLLDVIHANGENPPDQSTHQNPFGTGVAYEFGLLGEELAAERCGKVHQLAPDVGTDYADAKKALGAFEAGAQPKPK